MADSYLELAEAVLRRVRRPLSALEILRTAYAADIAPAKLRGRTQQKTLGARLSEDILHRRDHSRFYRTAPGRFLLREMLDDPSIPSEQRQPIVARRRKRSLPSAHALAFDGDAFESSATSALVDPGSVLSLLRQGHYHYAHAGQHRQPADVVVWAFVIVKRSGFALSYRHGAYREHRDTFQQRRTIGFYTPVIDSDLTLFEQIDHGIVTSGMKALAYDLDMLDQSIWQIFEQYSKLETFVYSDEIPSGRDLLAVVSFACPDWLDPTSKRLAINDLEWVDLRCPPNHIEDYDPWSQAVLNGARELVI